MVQHPIPLELAQKVAGLQGSKEWEVVLEYLHYRKSQLNDSMFMKLDEKNTDEMVVKVAMMTRGGVLEIINLESLMGICKGICTAESNRAEAQK